MLTLKIVAFWLLLLVLPLRCLEAERWSSHAAAKREWRLVKSTIVQYRVDLCSANLAGGWKNDEKRFQLSFEHVHFWKYCQRGFVRIFKGSYVSQMEKDSPVRASITLGCNWSIPFRISLAISSEDLIWKAFSCDVSITKEIRINLLYFEHLTRSRHLPQNI